MPYPSQITRRLAGLLGSAVLLSGCVPYPRSQAAYTELCQERHEFTVQTAAGVKTFFLYTYLRYHNNFSIQLIGFNKHRVQPAHPAPSGETAIPMLFDSRAAVIIREDGTHLAARPELYLGGTQFDLPRLDTGYARPSPYNINSDEVHRRIPQSSVNRRYGSVYVLFDVTRFDLTAKWTITLGTLEIEGQKIAIPPLALCYQPETRWIGLEPLIRP